MPDEYIVPFGVDANPYLKGISDMEDATDGLTKKADAANKTLQTSFDASGAAAKRAADAAAEYQTQLDLNSKSAQSYFQFAERLRILNEALFTETDKGRIKAYQIEIDNTKAAIQQLQNIGKTGFDDMGNAIVKQKGIIEGLNESLARWKQRLNEATDPTKIAKLNQQIEITKTALDQASNIGKTGFDKMGVAIIKQQGLLERLKTAADQYRVAIQKSNDPSQIAVYNKGLQGLNTEISRLNNVGKTGFDDLGNALEKTGKSTNVLSKGFGFIRQAAYLIPGIGIAGIFNLIGEAVITLATNLIRAGDGFDAIAQKNKLLTTVQQEANKTAGKQLTDLKFLYDATQNTTLSIKDRTDAVIALQAEFPEAFKNISQETILNGGAKKSYDDLTLSILASAKATAAKAELDKLASQRLDIEFQKQKIRNANAQENAKAAPQNFGGAGGAASGLTKEQVIAANNARAEAALKEQDIQDTRLKNQQDFLVKFAGGEQAIVKVIETKDQKKEAEMKRHNDAAAKLAADELKNFNNLLAKFASQDAELQAKAIDESEQQQLATSDAHFAKIKADAQRDVDNAKVNAQQRAVLQTAANKVIEDADAASSVARLLIQKKFNDQRVKLQEAGQAALDSITLDPQEKELAAINKHYSDLTDAIRKGGLLTKAAQVQIENARIQAIDDVDIKFGIQSIDQKEKLDIQAINVDQKYADKSVAIQKQKQLAILDVELKAAEQTLALLLANGKTENDTVVKNAEETIANLKNQILGVQTNKGKGQTLLEFLGITPDGQKNLQLYAAAASEAGKITSDFLGGLVDSTQQAIDAKQKLVDADNAAIDTLQQQLDKEMNLRDQGLANNVATIQKELDAKKAARDADLKSQKDLQQKQNALKKAQIIADSIAQVSNLITAASEIFATFAEIPIVGIPLAIAAIGLMFGAFAVAKVNAFKAVDAGSQSFGEGGYIDGKPHSQGGKKYRAVDGKGMVELEGGEHVTNKRSTKKYSSLLDAINNDDLGGMSEDGLRDMFANMGIGFGMDSPREAVKVIHKHNELKQTFNLSLPADTVSQDVKNISSNVSYLAEKERSRPERWTEGGYLYEKKGNKTTKTKI